MVQIKICGIKREEDLINLIELNVSWAGFIFYDKSIRNVNVNQERLFKICKNKIGIVALFVNPKDSFIELVINSIKPDLIQLHGSETPERCDYIKNKFGIPVMKAFHINNLDSFKMVYKFEKIVDRLLFDAKLTNEKLIGKKAEPFKWELLKYYKGNKDWMLAGGLNYNNIKKALKITGAKCIDVSSGVEISPGIKSKLLIEKLIREI